MDGGEGGLRRIYVICEGWLNRCLINFGDFMWNCVLLLTVVMRRVSELISGRCLVDKLQRVIYCAAQWDTLFFIFLINAPESSEFWQFSLDRHLFLFLAADGRGQAEFSHSFIHPRSNYLSSLHFSLCCSSGSPADGCTKVLADSSPAKSDVWHATAAVRYSSQFYKVPVTLSCYDYSASATVSAKNRRATIYCALEAWSIS